jgi:hypothetical protein
MREWAWHLGVRLRRLLVGDEREGKGGGDDDGNGLEGDDRLFVQHRWNTVCVGVKRRT